MEKSLCACAKINNDMITHVEPFHLLMSFIFFFGRKEACRCLHSDCFVDVSVVITCFFM